MLASTKKRYFRIFGITFLVLLLISILMIAKNMDDRQKELLEVERVSLVNQGEKVFTPKELLETKGEYQGKMVNIRAQVYQEPIVCEKITCSEFDKCCGCPPVRDLLVQDFRINAKNLY
jgi:hypothetical protein